MYMRVAVLYLCVVSNVQLHVGVVHTIKHWVATPATHLSLPLHNSRTLNCSVTKQRQVAHVLYRRMQLPVQQGCDADVVLPSLKTAVFVADDSHTQPGENLWLVRLCVYIMGAGCSFCLKLPCLCQWRRHQHPPRPCCLQPPFMLPADPSTARMQAASWRHHCHSCNPWAPPSPASPAATSSAAHRTRVLFPPPRPRRSLRPFGWRLMWGCSS